MAYMKAYNSTSSAELSSLSYFSITFCQHILGPSLKAFLKSELHEKIRAKTAQAMAYSENKIQSRQLQTAKTVADCKDNFRLSRQLHTVRTVANFKTGINCKLNFQKESVRWYQEGVRWCQEGFRWCQECVRWCQKGVTWCQEGVI